jgi:YD repeat-containing protein
MTLDRALRNGWRLIWLDYDRRHALVERRRPDGLRERALALRTQAAAR